MKIFYALVLAGLMAACTTSTKTNDDPTNVSDSTASVLSGDSNLVNTDTLAYGSLKMIFSPVSQEEYNALKTPSYLQKDSINVTKKGLRLYFKINGKTGEALFIDDTSSVAESYQKYELEGYIPDIHQWLVSGTYYESNKYFLISDTDGSIVPIYGIPFLSPDKHKLICGSVDLIAGFNPNGIQVFEWKDNKISKIFESGTESWGADEFKWKDNHTLLSKQTVVDDTLNQHPAYSSVQLNF